MTSRIIIIVIVLTSIFLQCKAQSSKDNDENEKKMEIIYEKKIDSLTIRLERNNVTYLRAIDDAIGCVDWKTTIMNNKRNESLVIDHHQAIKNTTAWKLGEINGESPMHFYNIVTAFINAKKLHIIKYVMGSVIWDIYEFKTENNFDRKSFVISYFPTLTALGEPYALGNNIIIDSNIFLYQKVGVSLGGSTEGIYKCSEDSLVQYNFSGDCLEINDEKKIFRFIDLNKDKSQVEEHIKTLLVSCNEIKETDKFKYLGYLDDFSSHYSNVNSNRRSKGIIYLFYEDNSEKTNIIRYNNYKNEWVIGNYEEVKIPSEEIYIH